MRYKHSKHRRYNPIVLLSNKCFFPSLLDFIFPLKTHLRSVSGDIFKRSAASFNVRNCLVCTSLISEDVN